MADPTEVLVRVKSKLTWAVEHSITPTLDAEEMRTLLSELERLSMQDQKAAEEPEPVVASAPVLEPAPAPDEDPAPDLQEPKVILRKGRNAL